MGLFDTLGRIFGRRKPLPPKIGAGHRGAAIGSRKKPQLQSYEERIKKGHEEIPASEVEDFLYNHGLLFVNSTNVAACQYFPESNQMMVEYLNGSAYLYDNVTSQEALAMANAQSKGIFVWSFFRVRGSATAHKKPYKKIR